MLIKSYILPKMQRMDSEMRSNMLHYERQLMENGIGIRGKAILTARIVLYVLQYPCHVSAWAFYPVSGISEYESSDRNDGSKDIEEFLERCTDSLLKQHNWHNPEVERVIEYRKEALLCK